MNSSLRVGLRPRWARSVAALLVASSVGSLVGPTFAPLAQAADKQACIAGYEATQKLKKDGKLTEARKQALVCAQDGCPTTLRDECAGWAAELEKAMPTIVIVVTDADGKDVTDATVYVDGAKVAIDGKALPVDPGTHKVRVEREGVATLEQDVVAHEGTKGKVVTLKFAKGDAKKPDPKDHDPTPGPTPGGPAKPGEDVPTPTATWVLLGIGAVGLVGFGAFALSGNSKKKALDDAGCKPNCQQSDVDAAKQSFLLADVSLGVSVVSFGVAIILYATRGPSAPTTTDTKTSSFKVDVAPTTKGGMAAFTLKF